MGGSPRIEMGGINTKQTRVATERPSPNVYCMPEPFAFPTSVNLTGQKKRQRPRVILQLVSGHTAA